MQFETLEALVGSSPILRATLIIVASLLAALVVRLGGVGLLLRLVKNTKTDVDDQLVQALGKPVFVSIFLGGTAYAISGLALGPTASYALFGVIKSLAVFVWAEAALKIGGVILSVLGAASNRTRLVQPTTLPVFQMIWSVSVLGGSVYFAFLAWDIDVTGWMASAGIVGIAVGFAAKDTLANLFAGVFILTDAPYKVGDYIVLAGQYRGVVTRIGLRSTRILTRDDVEVTVPNAAIANERIVNETGGPHQKLRVRVPISVAYGSDVDEVREVLLGSPVGIDSVCEDPPPVLRFREFGNSGLLFELRVWADEPVNKGRIVDALNTKIYKALMAAGIEIPYDKRDVYVKELPPLRNGGERQQETRSCEDRATLRA